MSASNPGEGNTSMTGEETHSLDGHEVEDVVVLPLTQVFPLRREKYHGRLGRLLIP